MIHATAIIDATAELDTGVQVGPYTVIGPRVKVGRNTRIGHHVVIDGFTEIGEGCTIFQFASLGAIPQDLKYKGEESRVIIGSNNTIREFVTINRGTALSGGKTLIGNNNLFMAYSHVAHDCTIGNHVVLVLNPRGVEVTPNNYKKATLQRTAALLGATMAAARPRQPGPDASHHAPQAAG